MRVMRMGRAGTRGGEGAGPLESAALRWGKTMVASGRIGNRGDVHGVRGRTAGSGGETGAPAGVAAHGHGTARRARWRASDAACERSPGSALLRRLSSLGRPVARRGVVMGLHPLRLLAAAVLLALAALGGAPGASAQTGVPGDWALKPSGLSGGDQFRLLFITSTGRNAQSTDIADYNTFVQGAAAAGHQAIRSHSSGFRVVGCTEAVDARDNTSTTYTSADKGVPIYWLGGNKVADEYEDFYDESWDDEANPKNESGLVRDLSGTSNGMVTGCNHDGTEAIFRGGGATTSEALGRSMVRRGRLDSSSDGPLSSSAGSYDNHNSRPLYGLSQVFQVNTPATGTPEISGFPRVGDELTPSTGDIADADGLTGVRYEYQWVRVDGTGESDIALANGTTYRLAGADLGKTVKVRVSFTDDAGSAESITSNAFPDGGVLATAVCEAPVYEGGQREIWKAELKLANYQNLVFGHADFAPGSLSDNTFTFEDWEGTQTITQLYTGIGQVNLSLAEAPNTFAPRDPYLTLHVCGERFNFGDASDHTSGAFTWYPVSSDWSTYSTRTVRLSVDKVAPTLVSSKLDGRSIKLTFSEALDESADVPASAFYVEERYLIAGNPTDALSLAGPISISDNTVMLTLVSPPSPLARATLYYTSSPGGGGIQLSDLTGDNRVEDFSVKLTNSTPVLETAELAAAGTTLTLTYDEALDTSSVPAPGAFTVTGGGAVKRVSSVSVSGSTVRLALASDPPGSEVTVSYAAPAANRLRDTAGNNAASFTDEAVTVRRAGPADQLVGNLAQPRVFTHEFVRSLATSFTTGRNAGGYAIAGVDVATANGNAFDAALCATLDGRPSDRCVTLVRPADFHGGSGRAGFTAPAGTVLTPRTRYALVVSRPEAHSIPNIKRTFSRRADAGRAQDWYFHADVRWADRKTGSWNSGGAGQWRTPLMFAVRGAPVPEPSAPSTSGKPGIGEAGTDGQWTSGETVQVTIAFDEAVTVDTTDGTPSVALRLGGSAEQSAAYASGSGTAELVFEYTLVAEDGTHSSMEVTANSLALNGGTIRSMANAGVNAALAHEGASRVVESTGVTARFEALPESHDGERTFTFELHFNVAPHELSYRRVQGSMTLGSGVKVPFFDVSGGAIATARRLVPGSNQGWEVTVRPTQAGDLTITLPAGLGLRMRDGWAGLWGTVTATVKGVALTAPFTAAFANVPGEHDGTNRFEVHFNLSVEPAPMSYVTARDALFAVTGGTIVNASRAQRNQNRRWILVVAPSGDADVTLTVNETTACDSEPGICTSDGRMLGGGATAAIPGPARFSVADAEVEEAAGATLDFVVTLSRARAVETSVGYATADGTATAGSDYTAKSGRLTFMAGETEMTVEVAVMDDAHDEGSETLTFTLSNPSGAVIDDGEATGTITNADAMPKAWIARFGRTVAEQVLDAVAGRLEAPRAAGVEASLAGQRLGGAGPSDEASDQALERREAEERMTALADWVRGETAEEEGPQGFGTRAVSERELLLGSSFALTGGSAETGFGALWGRASVSGFDGRDGELSVDGEVTSALLGADWTGARATAGLALAHSRGEGSYRSPGGDGAAESTLTGVYPYGRYALSERVSLWGVAGLGRGSLTLKPAIGTRIETDMALAMGALGLRGVLVEAPAEGGMELSVKTDAMAVRTTSDAARGEDGGNMAAAEADVTRLRLGLQATWHGVAAGGGTLTPSVEIGVRRDGGDAETGLGADIGAGLTWSDPERGISAEVRGRGLLTHEADGFGEHGFSGTVSWDPEPSTALGPSLTLTQTVGAASSGGGEALLGRGTMEGLAPDDGSDELERRHLEAKLGYGFALFGGGYTGTPQLGLGLTGSAREVSLGWRLAETQGAGLVFALDVEGARRESVAGDVGAEQRIGFDLGWRLRGVRREHVALEFGLEGSRIEAVNDNVEPEHRIGLRLEARW